MTDIIKRNTIEAIVENYLASLCDIKAGLELIDKAKLQMNAVLSVSDFKITPSYSRGVHNEIPSYETCKLQMKQNIWKILVNMSGVYNICSIRQRVEIDKMLYDEPASLPEITVEGVFSWMQNFMGSASSLYEDSVKEIFDWLRPRDKSYRAEYKTNMKYCQYVIGKKVILNWMFDSYLGFPSLRYDSEKWLTAMENSFLLADGKGTVKSENLISRIKVVQRNVMEMEDEYFKLKWFKKGTLHVEFKRMDLVEKMNAIAGGNNLKAA